MQKNNKWKKTATLQHAILVPSLLGLILEKPDMSPEEFLSIAAKLIREECIRLRLEKSADKESTGNNDLKGNNNSGKDRASSQGKKIERN